MLILLQDFIRTFFIDLIATFFVTVIVYPENIIRKAVINYNSLLSPINIKF